MKNIFIMLSFCLLLINTYGQQLPSDSLLLSTIFGRVDKTKNTATLNYTQEENKPHPDDKLVYSIVFKDTAVIEQQRVLIVICRAETFIMHGHQFGLTHTYLMKMIQNKWKIIYADVQSEDEMQPIGDNNDIKRVKIGAQKNALVFAFHSTGNHHAESDIALYYITLTGSAYIGSIDLTYSNEAWIDKEGVSDTADCIAYSYESWYKILPSGKDWYDIEITKETRTYDKGCTHPVLKEEEIIYTYSNGAYKIK